VLAAADLNDTHEDIGAARLGFGKVLFNQAETPNIQHPTSNIQ
jgi:hypothetical protein